jgi:ABC-type Mn2+/Zn2+ transport system permease subunit
MLDEFFRSWPLFQNSYLAGWIVSILLSTVGVVVVARDQVFIGAAVSEASTLGVAVGMWLTSAGPFQGVEWMQSDAFLSALAVASSIAAALVTARGGAAGQTTSEATTGWVFLAAASVSILIVQHSPHGIEEVHRLVSSSIIGSSRAEVWWLGGFTVIICTFLLAFRRRILLVLTDPEMAQASGLNTRTWALSLCCILGLTVGLSLRTAGMLYTFGCLVLPSLAARHLCRKAQQVFLAAPLVGLVTNIAAFILANHYDNPPGQMSVALLCCVAAAASIGRKLSPAR